MVLSERKGEGIPVVTVLPRDRRNLGLITVFFLSFLYDHWQVVLDENYDNNVGAEVVSNASNSFPLLISVICALKLG